MMYYPCSENKNADQLCQFVPFCIYIKRPTVYDFELDHRRTDDVVFALNKDTDQP